MRQPLATLVAVHPGRAKSAPRPGRTLFRKRWPWDIRIYATLLSEFGVLGRPARRRALALIVRMLPALVILATVRLLAVGQFDSGSRGLLQAFALLCLLITLLAAVWGNVLRAGEAQRPSPREELELGALFLVSAYVVIEATARGAAEPALEPLVYLVMAFLVAFSSRTTGWVLTGFAFALEILVGRVRGWSSPGLAVSVLHGSFAAAFAWLFRGALWARIARSRRAERAAISRRLLLIEERARALRLLGPGAEAPDEASWAAAAVVEVEAAVRGVLDVAEAALRSRTCAVYLVSEDERELRLLECRSPSDQVARGPFPAGEGALGAALKTKRPVRLVGELKIPSYVLDAEAPGALLVVPLQDPQGGHVRGVLIADRAEKEPFDEADERVLAALAAEILRASAAERLMADLRRARDEKEKVFGALERFNRLAKPQEVFEATLEIGRALGSSEFAALTMHEMRGDKRVHRVVQVGGPCGSNQKELENLEWPDDAGLVSSSVRLKSSLPLKDIDVARTPVFDPYVRLKGIASVRVLPLIVSGEALGTLVLGSSEKNAYGAELTRQAEIVAMQAAESILRARLFGETERLATTDGLTGILNHRTFQSRLDELLMQAQRYSKRAALLLCDIDHFKLVNDTYGHPAGDVVLRGVAHVLSREARATDLVARYGGEEFAILMPETDPQGAVVIAERIRERVAASIFETEQGSLRVTLSLGVAGYPEDGDKKARLVERADAYLYQAKRSGRNRTVSAVKKPGGERATA